MEDNCNKNENQTPSEKSSPSKKEVDTAQQALNHLVQGKRHLIVCDYGSAVTSLAEACKLLAEQYGETANECGDAYYDYGRALLEMAREETGVIGNISGDEKGNGDEDGEDGEGDGEGEEESQGEDNEESKAEEEEPAKDSTNNDQTEEEEGEEVTNLQLAWEVLELAKAIFQRQSETNPKLLTKLADTYMKLGEISMESENYKQAIDDIQECLKIQQTCAEEDSRYLAQTYYQLGTAYVLENQFSEAMKHYNEAVNVLQKRIDNFESKSTEETEAANKEQYSKDPFYTVEGEVTELKKLVSEIKEKVAETADLKERMEQGYLRCFNEALSKQEATSNSNEAKTDQPGASTSHVKSSSSSGESSSIPVKPACDISHLVKRKPKPEDPVGESDAKRMKKCE